MKTKTTILILLSIFVGCTKSNKDQSSTTSSAASSVKGKVLKLMLKDAVKTSDPTNSYDSVSIEVIDNIYEGVLQYNYFSEKLELIPNLASKMPQVSKDGLTYTLEFRKDIKFHDDACFEGGKGRTVTADDFIYSWKRHADPANESQAFWVWDNKVKGINDFQNKFGKGKSAEEIMKEDVEGFKKIDDYTVQIKLIKPYPQLIYILAMHFTSPVPREAVTKYGRDFVNHPVGTGPFKVQSWNPQSRIVLEKNTNYRNDTFPDASKLGSKYAALAKYSGKQLPLSDAIEFNVVKEDQPRWLGFMSGNFDFIPIPKDNFATALKSDTEVSDELAAKNIRVSIEPSYTFWYVTFNMKDKIVGTNKYLRQAIASALPAQEWLKKFKNGRGSTQNEISPPSVLDRCGKPYRWAFDVERAKKLMEKAGFPGGKGLPKLMWDTRGADLTERQLAEFIQICMKAIGIELEINTNTFPAFLDKMNKGALQISKGGWGMDYPDAENNYQLLYGPNKSPGPNDANFDNPEYNKLFEKMAALPSGKVRSELICKLEEIIQEETPWAYGIYENEYRLVQPWVPAFHTAELITNKYKYIETERSF